MGFLSLLAIIGFVIVFGEHCLSVFHTIVLLWLRYFVIMSGMGVQWGCLCFFRKDADD